MKDEIIKPVSADLQSVLLFVHLIHNENRKSRI
jgi:hypothetical protein